VYIDPADTCIFAETVSMIGDCATYYDEPTLIGPIDGLVPTSTFFGGTVTMTNAALTATYGPGGLLAEGVHSLVRPLNALVI
jgi:hypothetical protein